MTIRKHSIFIIIIFNNEKVYEFLSLLRKSVLEIQNNHRGRLSISKLFSQKKMCSFQAGGLSLIKLPVENPVYYSQTANRALACSLYSEKLGEGEDEHTSYCKWEKQLYWFVNANTYLAPCHHSINPSLVILSCIGEKILTMKAHWVVLWCHNPSPLTLRSPLQCFLIALSKWVLFKMSPPEVHLVGSWSCICDLACQAHIVVTPAVCCRKHCPHFVTFSNCTPKLCFRFECCICFPCEKVVSLS